jgi:putative colanic acid biosynthesis glycosyltransferase
MANPTRILRVSTTVQKGGAGAHVKALNNAINQDSNFESHLLCPRDHLQENHAVPYAYGRLIANFNFLKTKFIGLDSYFEPVWVHHFKKLIPQFDIVHLHHLQGYFFDLRSLKLLRDKNVVLTMHDVWPLTGRCSVLTDCDLWQSHCGHCPRLDIYPSTFIDLSRFLHKKKKELFKSLDRLKVVVLSRYSEELLKKSYLRDAEYVVIPPGIDCSIFRPLTRVKSDVPVLGVMAAKPGVDLKGFDVILNLIEFLAQNKNVKYHIHIVGSLDAKMQRLLSKYSFVKHTPFVAEEEDLSTLYNRFDLFLNFSRQETFGKTVVEAQSCGVPVLARRIPAFEENVLFGELIADVQPASLNRIIEQMLVRSWNKTEMHACMQRYSVQNMAERYIKLYNSFF